MTTPESNTTVSTQPISVHELKALVKASGPNKRKQAINLITACIEGKIDTTSCIMDAAGSVGLSRGQVALTLKEGLGERWRYAERVYTLIR